MAPVSVLLLASSVQRTAAHLARTKAGSVAEKDHRKAPMLDASAQPMDIPSARQMAQLGEARVVMTEARSVQSGLL